MGTGHVMRCLTLADALRERGAQCTFICRPHRWHLLDLIRQSGHAVLGLDPCDADFSAPPEPAHAAWLGADWASDAEQTRQAIGSQPVDWLVVDHYALDHRWLRALRPHCKRIMVIDDLADRQHDCDLLLDQNLGRTEKDYGSLLKSETRVLVGPQYALLRPQFAQWRPYSLQRRAQAHLKKLLITMGGVDEDNTTGQILDVLKACDLPPTLEINVVMGPHAPWLAQVQQLAAQMPHPTQMHVGVSHMAQLMADSDLAIGAAGGTAWERCALGLPTLMLVLADNQRPGAAALQAKNAAVLVPGIQQIGNILMSIAGSPDKQNALRQLSVAAADLADGQGVSHVLREVSDIHV